MISACLFAGGFLYAAAAQDKEDVKKPGATAAGTPAAGDKKSSRRSQKPATTFKPSERIRADSAVSFPVDI